MQLLDENFLWVEKVPPEVRANIIASADLNGDGFITQDEFIHLGRLGIKYTLYHISKIKSNRYPYLIISLLIYLC